MSFLFYLFISFFTHVPRGYLFVPLYPWIPITSIFDKEKCLQEADRAKKKMYLEACLQKLRHFSLFFASVDGLLGVEARATLKILTIRFATKWKQP